MRCLRAGENASSALGRRGAPPGGIRTSCQELADGLSPRDHSESAARVGRHRDGAPAGAARVATRARVVNPARKGQPDRKGGPRGASSSPWRLPALHPLIFWGDSPRAPWGKEKGKGSPRAPQTTGAAERWLFQDRTGEGMNGVALSLPSSRAAGERNATRRRAACLTPPGASDSRGRDGRSMPARRRK